MSRVRRCVMIPVLCAGVCFLSCFSLLSEDVHNSVVLNFDKLFPQSPIQIMLESCMRMQHELLWYATRDYVDDAQAEELVDLVVGRLYHVRSCAQEVVTCHLIIQEDDLSYLFSLLETIQETYQTLLKKILPAHGKHALALLSDISAALNSLAV